MTKVTEGSHKNSVNMPCASMPVSTGEAPAFVHPKLVTYLTGFQQYLSKGGLIPHLTRKDFFWMSQPTAINNAVLQYKIYKDGESAAYLDKLDKVECGHLPPHSRVHSYNGTTGLHNSLGPNCTLKNVQYWIRQDGATSKAASPAAPQQNWHFSARTDTEIRAAVHENASSSVCVGHIPENASAESSPIALNQDGISLEPYTGHAFPSLEMAPSEHRHHGTMLNMQAIGTNFNWTLNQEIVFSAAPHW